MADDWKPGDLALCVTNKRFTCFRNHVFTHHSGAYSPPVGAVREVDRVERSGTHRGHHSNCGCLALIFKDGTRGIVRRFRKINPHTPDAEDAETIRLLTGKPVEQVK